MPFPAVRELLAEWDGRIAAADPARQRIRLATRAALSLGLAVAVMGPVGASGHQPVTVTMLAGIVAVNAATSVKDTRRTDALVTFGAATLVALAVVACVAWLSPHPTAADITFVVVMTAAVLARRFGQRGFALGQLAFMTYFFALFLQARAHQLPWMALAVGVGTSAAALVRCVLLPDRPAADLRRSLRAVEARVAGVADEVRLWLAADPRDREGRTRLLVRAGSRLGEVALLVERALEQPDADRLVADVDGLRGLIFDLEVSTEHLSDAVRHEGPLLSDRARARFVARAGRLAFAARAGRPVQASRTDALGATAEALEPRSDDAQHLASAFARVEHGTNELSRVQVARRLLDGYLVSSPAVAPAGGAVSAGGGTGGGGAGGGGAGGGRSGGALSLTTRTAIQVAVAGALAIVAGHAISPARWFWAVLASYVVFINATTSTATLRRAFGRVAGTVGGVAAGLLLGKAIAGDPRLAVALIIALVFLAFWLVAVSYAGLVLCVTLGLAALYSILGTLSWALLRLRLEETLAGAVIGAVVAVVVLPRRADAAIDEDIGKVLSAAADLLDRLTGDPDPVAIRAAVRDLDQRFQDLRATIRPTVVGLPGPEAQRRRRQLLHTASVRYWARTLAIGWQPGVVDLAPVRAHLDQVRQQLAHEVPVNRSVDVGDRSPSSGRTTDEGQSAVAVRGLEEALDALADERGLPRRTPEAAH